MKINNKTNKKDGNIEIKNGQIIYNFNPSKIISNEDALKLCYYFAVAMKEKHNQKTIGNRSNGQVFIDDFRGKYGEIVVRNDLIDKGYVIKKDLDFNVLPRKQWDKEDLIISKNNSQGECKRLSIKSVKSISENILIESNRFTSEGEYSYPNDDGSKIIVDIYVLIKIGIEPELKPDEVYSKTNDEFIDFDDFLNINEGINTSDYKAVTNEEFWSNKAYVPKDVICSKRNLSYIFDRKNKYNQSNLWMYKYLPHYYTSSKVLENEEFNSIKNKKCLGKDARYYYQENNRGEVIRSNYLKNNEIITIITTPNGLKENNYFIPYSFMKDIEEIF